MTAPLSSHNDSVERTARRVLAGIILVALLIRVAYAFYAPLVDPILEDEPLYGDASGYHLLAENLLQGNGLSFDGRTLSSFRMPGYPVFLAGVYWLLGAEPLAVRLVQALLGALTCIPVFLIGRRLGGDVAGVLAALGVALHPILLYMTGWVYSETLFLLLLWTGLWLFVRILDAGAPRYALLAGVVLGIATLVRPEIVFLPLFVAAIGVVLRWPRRVLGAIVFVQVVLLVVILPWTVRNTLTHGKLVLLTTNTGAVFYGGNNFQANGGYHLDVPFVLPGYSEVESNAELTRRAAAWIAQNPTQFALLLPEKLYRFFAPTQMEHSGSPFGRWTLPMDILYTGFLLIAAVGAASGWRTEQRTVALLSSVVLWYVLIALVIYGGTRVALPVAPGLVILASIGLIHLVSRLRAPARTTVRWA